MPEGRYELKYHITPGMCELLKRRINCMMPYDAHAGGAGYTVSSLYFDDYMRSAYSEKINGEAERKKYRIRTYNHEQASLKLECKMRRGGLIYKKSGALAVEAYHGLMRGNTVPLLQAQGDLHRRFYALLAAKNLMPAVVVEYRRVAFTGDMGLRVTFDSGLKASVTRHDLFDPGTVMLYAQDRPMVVMEVKFNSFLPQYVQMLLGDCNIQPESISKYILCADRRREVGGL